MSEFDYIIVGAGSAGCVLANRLSADPGARVCLLEAGRPDNSVLIDTPIGVVSLLAGRTYNWAYSTEPQAHLAGRRLYWPRGKTLGGSSSMNGLLYVRGHRGDYDEWEAMGAAGWGWDQVLPLFKTIENNERGADAYHGTGGELNVADPRTPHPLAAAFLQACAEAGLPFTGDFNGIEQEGAGRFQATQKAGRRVSAARAFLDPVRYRQNLTILTGAHVSKILIENGCATGVEAKIGRTMTPLTARREVILCGGVINSPQLLLLSGIGPGDELARLGIEPLLDMQGVGRNLQDHLDTAVITKDLTRTSIGIGWGTIPALIKGFNDFRTSGTGLFASVTEAGAFAKLTPESARPDAQYHFMTGILRDHGRKMTLGYGLTLHCCQLRPKSRGSVTLKSPDPFAEPAIQPNYLSHAEDVETLLAALKLGRRIMSAPAMRAITGGTEFDPGNGTTSDEQLVDYLRHQAETVYHPVGTCKMGVDAMAVVDSRLRVRGIDRLRIADASIMPTITGGNTNAPAIMIGEKAARLILSDRNEGVT